MARVLLVDDEEAVRRVLRKALEAAGHEVVDLASGTAVVDAQEARPADVAIIDIFMPDRDGIEAIRDLRGGWPQLPIIAMSGGGSRGAEAVPAMLRLASHLGARDVLTKPFELAHLTDLVESAVGA